jgi:hypothetical protein
VIPLERSPGGALRARLLPPRHPPDREHEPAARSSIRGSMPAGPAVSRRDLEASGWPVDRHGAQLDPRALRHLAAAGGPSQRRACCITLIASHAGSADGLAQDRRPLEWLAAGTRWWASPSTCSPRPRQPADRARAPITIGGRGWLHEPFCRRRAAASAPTPSSRCTANRPSG